MNQNSFIDESHLHQLLKKKSSFSNPKIHKILQKALKLKGLNLQEVSVLLNISDVNLLHKLFRTASKIKNSIYGKRLVIFAPLYISNYCNNNCLYCGFRRDNKDMKRKCLNFDEIKNEAKIILDQGHKRILMLMGGDFSKCDLDYFNKSIKEVYSVTDSFGNRIRRINVEIPSLSEPQLKELSHKKIGTYTVFQETYHQKTYEKMHPSGKKADYFWRLFTMDRALSAGLQDVGIGALFGLYDYRFEVLALISHANYLEKNYRVGPHTISVPRIEPAQNAPASVNIPSPVSDDDFKKLVAILRCAVPYTGIILSTRESPQLREELLNLGVSQISAGSKTNPNGYKRSLINPEDEEQFSLNDTRSTGEVIRSVIEHGFVPSFCTGCYRLGRTGQDFMDYAKPGLIRLHCLPNALTTLKEYLVDYADCKTRIMGEQVIKEELDNIGDEGRKEKTIEYLKRIENGERDLYF